MGSLNTVTKRTNMTTSTTTTSTAMRMMITNLTMAIRRNRTVTITVTKRILMAATMVTRRIPTVKITMVINNPMEDTVKSNLMVIKATVMVMATNNTEDMDVKLTDTVTNLPMVTDTNLTDMDPDHLMADTDNLMVDMDNNPMVMVMDTNLNTVITTTNNLTDIKAMEVTVMAMVINNTEAMVIDKPTEDTVTSNLMVNTTATTTNLTE